MAVCALVDANGTVVSAIVADPGKDAAPNEHRLVAVHDGTCVEEGWRHDEAGFHLPGHYQDVRFSGMRLPQVPRWKTPHSPFTAVTPASEVIKVCEARIPELQAARGFHGFRASACPAYATAKVTLTHGDTCETFCTKIADSFRSGAAPAAWVLDFIIVTGGLLPEDALARLIDVLPVQFGWLAKRLLSAPAAPLS